MTPREILNDYANGDPDPAVREALEPLPPGDSQWNAVNRAIHRGIDSESVQVQTHDALRWLRRGLVAAGGIAAAIVVALFITSARKNPEDMHPEQANEPAEFAVMPIASEHDVVIERIAGSGHGLIVGDVPLQLAREEDIEIEGTEPHPAWPGGSPKMITAPGDIPMIFAAKGR